jgi:hypothetical protein
MPAINHERREQVRKMREQGMSFAAIGAALDPPVSGDCVAKTARAMGLPGKIALTIDKRGSWSKTKNTRRDANRPGA